jgi:hypothetical protein
MNRRELIVGALVGVGAALVPDWARPAEGEWVARQSPASIPVLALQRVVWQPGTLIPAQYEATYCGRLLPDRYFLRNGWVSCDPVTDKSWLGLRLQPLRLEHDRVTGWYGGNSLHFALPDPEVTIAGEACDGPVFAPERLIFDTGDPESTAAPDEWMTTMNAKLKAMRPVCLRDREVTFEQLASGGWRLLPSVGAGHAGP